MIANLVGSGLACEQTRESRVPPPAIAVRSQRQETKKERPTRTPILHGGGYKSGQLLPRSSTAGRQTRIPSRRRPPLPRGPATASGPAEHRSSGCKRRGGSGRASALPTSARGRAHPPRQPVPLLTGGPSPFHGSSAPHPPTPPHPRSPLARRRPPPLAPWTRELRGHARAGGPPRRCVEAAAGPAPAGRGAPRPTHAVSGWCSGPQGGRVWSGYRGGGGGVGWLSRPQTSCDRACPDAGGALSTLVHPPRPPLPPAPPSRGRPSTRPPPAAPGPSAFGERARASTLSTPRPPTSHPPHTPPPPSFAAVGAPPARGVPCGAASRQPLPPHTAPDAGA